MKDTTFNIMLIIIFVLICIAVIVSVITSDSLGFTNKVIVITLWLSFIVIVIVYTIIYAIKDYTQTQLNIIRDELFEKIDVETLSILKQNLYESASIKADIKTYFKALQTCKDKIVIDE